MLILVAKDASDHTWRRAKSFAAGTRAAVRSACPPPKTNWVRPLAGIALAIAASDGCPDGPGPGGRPAREKATNPALEVLTAKAAKAKKRQQRPRPTGANLRRGKKHMK